LFIFLLLYFCTFTMIYSEVLLAKFFLKPITKKNWFQHVHTEYSYQLQEKNVLLSFLNLSEMLYRNPPLKFLFKRKCGTCTGKVYAIRNSSKKEAKVKPILNIEIYSGYETINVITRASLKNRARYGFLLFLVVLKHYHILEY
jgi:hypothetical protein